MYASGKSAVWMWAAARATLRSACCGRLPSLDATLVDLSQPMLERARDRVAAVGQGSITIRQADIRELELGAEQFDIILAAAVLHHLRNDHEWYSVFAKFLSTLRPGGCVWIYDMVERLDGCGRNADASATGKYLR